MGVIVPNLQGWSAKALRQAATLCFIVAMLSSLVGCATFDNKLRMIAFRPTPGKPADFKGLRSGDLVSRATVPGTSDEVQLWWLPGEDPEAPTVLYLHGTFRNLYQNLPKIDAFRQAGYSVVGVEYRGWGDSTTLVPNESTIYADAEVGFAELARRQPDPRKRVLYGHSMGGGVAVELASRRRFPADYGALVVESTFSRWPDVAAVRGVLGTMISWLAADEFDSVGKIGRVDGPVMILHGAMDTTIPVTLAYRLRDAAPPGARFIEVSGGGHSRLYRDAPEVYQRALQEVKAKLKTDGTGWPAPPEVEVLPPSQAVLGGGAGASAPAP